MARPSASPGDTNSGRRVRHSRNGCVSCKERRLRCSEERPSCSRCSHDGTACEYLIRLIWEDESSERGVKHGRGKHTEPSNIDPTPPKGLATLAQWTRPRSGRKYFLNTTGSDLDGAAIEPLSQLCLMRPRAILPHFIQTPALTDLSKSDGMFLQYYRDNVCQSLALVNDSSNSYLHIVLPLSMSYDCVMKSVLAVGALYLSIRHSEGRHYAVALQHKQRALSSLRRNLSSFNGSSKNHILVSMLMLCLFDITDNCQSSWSTHVSGAASLITANNLDPSLVSFVSKFFATRDVMGRSACGKRSKFQEIAWENAEEVEKSVGCSSELLNIISSITDLSRQLDEGGKSNDKELDQRVLDTEIQLETLVQILPISNSATSPAMAVVLSQTSSLIHCAAKIYFYTALHSAGPSTHIIRSLVADQVNLIKNISEFRSAHLWSIFVTALYAFDDEERIFFMEQFDKLVQVATAMASAQAARSIVQTVWKRRDLDADSDAKKEASPALSDWARFVRPMSEGLSLA